MNGRLSCKTAEEARRKAERLAPLREGVVAFAALADVELGDHDENPEILFRAGRLLFRSTRPDPV